VAAPPGTSAGYLLTAGGGLQRTLSAGAGPAALRLSPARVIAGHATKITATASLGLRGNLVLRARTPGRSWATLQTFAWRETDWDRSVSLSQAPSGNREYELAFTAHGISQEVSDVVTLGVAPRLTPAHARYVVREGSVYRFSGTVNPAWPGERVELLTDRGGGWRPVSLQPSVALRHGRTWTSRPFGTPRAETYHLRVHLTATRRHAEAWSRIVTVVVRR